MSKEVVLWQSEEQRDLEMYARLTERDGQWVQGIVAAAVNEALRQAAPGAKPAEVVFLETRKPFMPGPYAGVTGIGIIMVVPE